MQSDYRAFVEWTLRNHPERRTLVHAALGLAGETGEVVEQLKRQLAYGKPLDRQALLEEIGDVRWYLELLCLLVETDLVAIEALNVAKLTERFGGK